MHLTNYAINKESDNFEANYDASNDDVGHKRSMTAIFKHIDHQYKKFVKEKLGGKCQYGENGLDGIDLHSDKYEFRNSDHIWKEIQDICVKTILSG